MALWSEDNYSKRSNLDNCFIVVVFFFKNNVVQFILWVSADVENGEIMPFDKNDKFFVFTGNQVIFLQSFDNRQLQPACY